MIKFDKGGAYPPISLLHCLNYRKGIHFFVDYIFKYVYISIYPYMLKEVKMLSIGKKIELLKVIAHPVRIRILEELAKGVKCVSDFEEFLEINQPNVSHHLSLLRRYGVVDYYVDGRLKCYFLVDPIIPDILQILKKDYQGTLPAPACCPVTKKGTYPGERRR
jgi:DNA-binding transcriptional ArsR family regulator